jgi:hypothetical protein
MAAELATETAYLGGISLLPVPAGTKSTAALAAVICGMGSGKLWKCSNHGGLAIHYVQLGPIVTYYKVEMIE